MGITAIRSFFESFRAGLIVGGVLALISVPAVLIARESWKKGKPSLVL